MKHFLVLGATSAIAQAFCREHAAAGTSFWLLGRNEARLLIVANDLVARGAKAETRVVLPGIFADLQKAVSDCFQATGGVDVFLAAQGALPSQELCEAEPECLAEFFHGSMVEVMQGSLLVAQKFEEQRHGVCVILGSVAGDRGRRGNFVYGAGKAALETFCEGLRQRLEPASAVIFVKPGPVDTPMTSHLKKTALFTSPEKVAAVISRAIRRRASVVYAPFYWRWIMTIIKVLPRGIVKGLRA